MSALAAALAVSSLVLAWLWLRTQRRYALAAKEAEHYARDLEKLERAFACFAPAAVIDQIFDRGISTTAEKRDVTVLFSDLQGFTGMSEQLDPTVVVRVLNGYFEHMCAAVKANHGHVAKFIGDGMMAVFGALENNPWQARDAVNAALAMRKALATYNQALAAEGLATLAFGVGIHHGTVVAGVMGTQELMDFTVIGDVVNTAARVETLTRHHGTDILVTADVHAALAGRFTTREMPPMNVKGKSEALVTFAIDGRAPESQ